MIVLEFLPKRRTALFWIIVICIVFQTPELYSNGPGGQCENDSISAQKKDSLLFKLNLQYLNGVNENKTPFELISIIEEILKLDTTLHNHWFNLGIENIKIHEYNRAIDALNKGMTLYPAEDNTTLIQMYLRLSYCYHKTEKHQKEQEILDFIARLKPDAPEIISRYIICAHSRMRFTEAEANQKQLVSILRTQNENESDIAFYLGRLYLNTDYLVAEKYFRTALQYDPDNIEKMGSLAWVLIQNALKIDEGMDLIQEVIAMDSTNAVYIHQQGYGFFVIGNYQEALSKLYCARKLYQQYNFDLDNHIRMVEEAIADLPE